ncbi:GNAT family N-acetyltransferase [Pectobacterium parmentieri]|uniref:GNAT family N-acetyltransferase n=1 Tax=Pectobacterium parmentieri TaxID=1905730 RepID=UPI0018E19CAB|nr:GNAT family N-acetyltransferase [Pectobacterium parmentieri]QQA77461.1 GNAT family N-acetyltransferase [Pectobacterium parmentieri]
MKVVRTTDITQIYKNSFYDLKAINIFQSANWMEANKTNNDSNNNFYLVIEDKNKVIGIFGFNIYSKNFLGFKIKTLSFIQNNLSDYSGGIYSSEYKAFKIAKELYGELLKPEYDWDLIDLDNISQDCSVNIELVSLLKNNNQYKTSLTHRSECPLLYLDKMENDVDKRQLKDVNRRKKRLEEEFQVQYGLGQTISEKELFELLDLKNEVYPDHELMAHANREIILSILKNGIDYDYSFIKVEGEIVAAHFGFYDESTFYYYIPVYRKKYSDKGVGSILMSELISFYHGKGKTKFDFLRGGEPYKKNWTSTTRYTLRFICAKNYKSQLYLRLFQIKNALY